MRLFHPVAAVCALLLSLPAVAGKLTTVATLPAHNDGAQPMSALTALGNAVYGVTQQGGAAQVGVLFKLDPSSGEETVVYTFQGGTDGSFPSSPLLVVNGKLYGTTYYGGDGNEGTVFSFDPATGTETVLDSVSGPYGQLVLLGGLLYGTNGGSVFSIDPSTGAKATVYTFSNGPEGRRPTGDLIAYNGALYGLTGDGAANNWGAIFRLDPATAQVTALYAFASGQGPETYVIGLVESGGVLYGTTPSGGADSYGTVFAFDLQNMAFSVVHTFNGTDGSYPAAGLLAADGLIYGTTEEGGTADAGTAFSINPATGAEKVLHSFVGSDGDFPMAPLIEVNGALLGTTVLGGVAPTPGGNGVVFSVDPTTGQDTTLHSFAGSESSTNSALTSFQGSLYGTSTGSGANGFGSIFKVDPKTGAEQTLYSFMGGLDGYHPATALVNVDGKFFGTTTNGGTGDSGTLFSFDPVKATKTVLLNFGAASVGTDPSVLTNVSGILYGTSFQGGAAGYGALFSFDPVSKVVTSLHAFMPPGGEDPVSGVIAVNGTLYGATARGGSQNYGTVFSYVLANGTFSTVYNFDGGNTGTIPISGLVFADDSVFGLMSTPSKKAGFSKIYQIDLGTGAETVLYTFSKAAYQANSLTAVGNVLYGPSPTFYGPLSNGYLFTVDIPTQKFATTYKFKGGADGGQPDSSLLSVGSFLYGTTPSLTAASGGTVFRIHR